MIKKKSLRSARHLVAERLHQTPSTLEQAVIQHHCSWYLLTNGFDFPIRHVSASITIHGHIEGSMYCHGIPAYHLKPRDLFYRKGYAKINAWPRDLLLLPHSPSPGSSQPTRTMELFTKGSTKVLTQDKDLSGFGTLPNKTKRTNSCAVPPNN